MSKLKIGKYSIVLSNEDKILFPKSKITKGDLIHYYDEICTIMMPHIKNRLITMVRYPEGIHHEGFYHKNAPDYFPDWIERKPIARSDGEKVNYVVMKNCATLIYLANQGCITPHAWLSKMPKINYPDRLIFDLDPSGKKFDFNLVRKAALALKDLLEELDLPAFVMTTGSRGLHVVVPIKATLAFDEVRAFARSVASYFAAKAPNHLTVELSKAKRGKRIFVDYLRNAQTATSVPPYAVRPLEGAPVATPLDWQEVKDSKLSSQRYTYKTVFKRLTKKGDAWVDIDEHAVSLKRAIKKMERIIEDDSFVISQKFS